MPLINVEIYHAFRAAGTAADKASDAAESFCRLELQVRQLEQQMRKLEREVWLTRVLGPFCIGLVVFVLLLVAFR